MKPMCVMCLTSGLIWQLVDQPVRLGGPGLIGNGLLTAAEAELVQRFDPLAGEGDDTIGFFIAKFMRRGPSCQ